ncbi:hypothetical protein Y032_0048g1725 [Ancylostoma ceylanicum]|nr:hypothetical protein Y032_0048g1725 [Ancylostoma ceylanicum]
MDQQGLTHHTSFFVNDEDQFHLHLEPATSLKTAYKSEPHLHIPHLLVSQDEAHPSLNRIVSGLFHVDNALHTPHASCGNLEALHKRHNLIRDVAATDSTSVIPQPPLRKSSSAVDWSVVADSSKSAKPWHWEGGDLSMTTPHSHSTAGGLMLQRNLQNQPASSSQGFVASSASPTQPPPSNPNEMNLNNGNQGHHVLGGVFHRGFFSKPVVRSDEENYRYLMALDR